MQNTHKLVLFSVLFLLLSCTLRAHSDLGKWKKGTIYLYNNETIKGELIFDQKLNLVQFKSGEKIKVFSPLQVKLFHYFDEKAERNRIYTTIPELKADHYHRGKFFEIVLTGNITLLRNNPCSVVEQVPVQVNENPMIRNKQFHYVNTIHYDYFIVHNEELKQLKNFRKELLPLIGLTKKEFRNFLAEHELDIHDREDQIRIIEHFNKKGENKSISLL